MISNRPVMPSGRSFPIGPWFLDDPARLRSNSLIRKGICAKSSTFHRGRPDFESPFAKQFSGVTRLADMADLIKADEAKMRLKKVPEWELEKKHIERTFEFDDFTDAIDFVNAVAEVAEEEEHHPDIDIRFNKVRLVLSTHSKGGLTDLD